MVVFRYPLNPREYFIKRVIGLPGETVEVRDGGVWVFREAAPEAVRLDEPYLPAGLSMRGEVRFTLQQDEYVVLGDNREFSSDSRNWGGLERKYITGRAGFRAWPVARLGALPQL